MSCAERFGIHIGDVPRGAGNRITDVPGVRVGHATLGGEHRTGVTLIMPCPENPFTHKLVAAAHVQNGFGKTAGLVQLAELGTLETPIALTNTLSVGTVSDALITYMLERCARERIPIHSINPVVGETNDARFNRIADRAVKDVHVFQAIESASDDFEEGDVGAGAGTVCHGLKGGIGSASRLVEVAGHTYTLGILVQSNHGTLGELTIRGRRIGEEILAARGEVPQEPLDRGSIMVILATDLPLSDRQLARVLRRTTVGLVRCGSYLGHGSGDVMIGFTTENRVGNAGMDQILTHRVLSEHTLERVFYAAAEATEEAVISSMLAARSGVALDGRRVESLGECLKQTESL